MEECRRPEVEYPTRVPMKIIGNAAELKPDMIGALILAHLGPQPEGELTHTVACKGAWASYTFWVTLRDEHVERPLREALAKLPGFVTQL